jgi:hypothetical protein
MSQILGPAKQTDAPIVKTKIARTREVENIHKFLLTKPERWTGESGSDGRKIFVDAATLLSLIEVAIRLRGRSFRPVGAQDYRQL